MSGLALTGSHLQVGGSNGFVSIHLATQFPKLHYVVQDLPKVVEDGLSKMPNQLSTRIKFMALDYLTEQLVRHADVYLFRWIFPNWSDSYCIRIPHRLLPALKKGSLVVLNDNVLPEPGSLGLWQEKRIRYVSFQAFPLRLGRALSYD